MDKVLCEHRGAEGKLLFIAYYSPLSFNMLLYLCAMSPTMCHSGATGGATIGYFCTYPALKLTGTGSFYRHTHKQLSSASEGSGEWRSRGAPQVAPPVSKRQYIVLNIAEQQSEYIE